MSSSIRPLLIIMSLLCLAYLTWETMLAPEISLVLLIAALKSREATDLHVCPRVRYVLTRYFQDNKDTLMNNVRNRMKDEDKIKDFALNRLRACLVSISTYSWNMPA